MRGKVKKIELLYEGKAKKVYSTEKKGEVIVEYKDDATAFNGEKRGRIRDKGVLNAAISAVFFQILEEAGIPNHFITSLNQREQLVKRLEIVPLEAVVRNIAAGSLAERLGLPEGEVLTSPVLELYYKDDQLGDPLINEDHIKVLGLADRDLLDTIKNLSLQINQLLLPYLKDRGIELVDFKLEFGRGEDGQIYLGDEISPDTCRFWDSSTGEKLDKDRFRRELGGVEGAYQEILNRLQGSE